MNSFTLTAVGYLARNPELVAKGNTAYTRFCLVGNDYAGKDEEGAAREVVTSLWLVAFGALGDAIARHSRKGDQLFVEARVRADVWTDKQGEKHYDQSFVVQGFRFGAPGRTKRDERDARRDDGHGLQRAEDRGNGRDRSANIGAHTGFGAGGGFGATAGVADTGVTAGANSSAAADAGTDSGADADAVDDTGADSGQVAVNKDPGVSGADDSTSRVASDITKDGSRKVANPRSAAGRGTEKSGGNRSNRRATASVA
jgi:single-strand DNA-binding protein